LRHPGRVGASCWLDQQEAGMTDRTSEKFNPESATAVLALVGVQVDPAHAAGIAQTLTTQVKGANKAFTTLDFETEPATYLVVSAKEAP
jgi:hypothetical protein